MKLSVIIPTLNEEAVLSGCIAGIRRLEADIEIIMADGGSSDSTVSTARSLGVRVCQSEPGRGIQCNAGAALATGEVMVFLHADTQLPDGAFQKLREIFSDSRVQCGTFRIAFDADHWFLRLVSFAMQHGLGFFRFGDQCLVLRRSFFESIGGFPPWRLFEDMELVRRARKRTRILRFPMTVTTSARRFLQNGIVRQQALNVWYTVLYLLGTPAGELAARYERKNGNLPDATLVILLRYPGPDQVKTRLAVTLGSLTATDFYQTCVTNLIREIRKLPGAVRPEVWHAGGTEKELLDWLGPGLSYLPQVDGDLGARLTSALNHSFRDGNRKAIAIASDVPDLSAKVITRAFKALDSADIVIGPSFDGGYYLIGMKQMHSELFRGMPWSTGLVYRQTLDTARRLGLSFRLLPVLRDIDTCDDLRTWVSRSRLDSPFKRFSGSLDSEVKNP